MKATVSDRSNMDGDRMAEDYDLKAGDTVEILAFVMDYSLKAVVVRYGRYTLVPADILEPQE